MKKQTKGTPAKTMVPEAEQRPDPTTTPSCSAGPSNATAAVAPTPTDVAAHGPTMTGPGCKLGESQTEGRGSATISSVSQRLSRIDSSNDSSVDNSPHLIVEARAGTGKTTTLVESLRRLRGCPTEGFIPSPQQQAVFDCVELSKGKASTACFVAFNRSIADELRSRVPQGVDAMTMHSMGLKAVTRAFPELRSFDLKNGNDVVPNVVANLLRRDVWAIRRDKHLSVVLRAVDRLVSLCKMNLTDLWGVDYDLDGWQRKQLSKLAAEYEVDLNDHADQIFMLVPLVLNACKEHKGGFNFDDMIWLPVVLDLPMVRYDLLMVDEAQDLNRCQQALARKAGRRLVLCGDPRQAIYGFAGADAESMPRMMRELSACTTCGDDPHPSATGRGCVTLPLTVTRRCGKAIVREANKIVREFEAHESNCEGEIKYRRMEGRPDPLANGTTDGYHELVREGDMVLCRVNSRLVSQCIQFIRMGRRAYIQGRDVGKGLVALVEKMEAGTVAELVNKLDAWCSSECAKEQAKTNPSESVVEGFRDRRDCVTALTDGMDAADHPNAVVWKIDQLFSDQGPQNSIRLSSIHRAKGTEAKRVFLLALPKKRKDQPTNYVMTWIDDPEQEFNLLYVAITRAIEELVYVS